MNWLAAHAGLGWTLASLAFIGYVALKASRKGRAHSKRAFVDEPTARARALTPDTRYDHSWDGFR